MAYAIVNGLTMYYEIHGAGPPLLMLHGGTCSIEYPPLGIPFFASEFQVVAMEQMGHGRTGDVMAREFHYHGMAEDTVELMRQLGIERTVVLGLSDGGDIGLDMAIHHPDRVTKLVVSGANFHARAYAPGAREWVLTTKPDEWPQELRDAYARLSPDGPGHWPVVVERQRPMWSAEPDYTHEQLASIKAPTLVISGDVDMFILEHPVELFRAIPGAQLCVVPHAGHGAWPKETILAFLKEAS